VESVEAHRLNPRPSHSPCGPSEPVCSGLKRVLFCQCQKAGVLRWFEVVPCHLGQSKVDVGSIDALRILLDIETTTRAQPAPTLEDPAAEACISRALNTAPPARCSSRSGPLLRDSSDIVGHYRRTMLSQKKVHQLSCEQEARGHFGPRAPSGFSSTFGNAPIHSEAAG
jgi:hypothetical protein